MLAKSAEEYFGEKLAGLRHALVPHLTEARRVIDARPIFDREHTKIEGYVLAAHLELTAHDVDGEVSRFPFYLSRADLRALQEKLKAAESKMDLLATNLAGTPLFE